MMLAVLMVAMPLPMLPRSGGRLILLTFSLGLALLARSPRRRLTATVVMRPVPALAIPLAAWAAMMTPLALAFGAIEFGLKPAETPDFLELRLLIRDQRVIYDLRYYNVFRRWRRLWRQVRPGSTLFSSCDRALSAVVLLSLGFGREGCPGLRSFWSLLFGYDLRRRRLLGAIQRRFLLDLIAGGLLLARVRRWPFDRALFPAEPERLQDRAQLFARAAHDGHHLRPDPESSAPGHA
jgi:hypothetical protein